MEIIKGSQEYFDYLNEYILPSREVEDYIFTLDGLVMIDMLDSGDFITYDDSYVEASMEEHGYILVIPE
tara:strand:+ start:296 stop:502 length:207 start_codon:yes stop_codon:yes gene_type:complete